MPITILFVCAADVCRSPAAAALAQRQLAELGLSEMVCSLSGAAMPLSHSSRCTISARWMGPAAAADAMLANPPRRIQAADIAEADLVLGLDHEVVARLLRLDPRQRGKLFTVREAAVLAAAVCKDVASPADFATGRLRRQAGQGRERMGSLIADLDAARGVVPLPGMPARKGLLRRTVGSAYDIEDVHGLSARQHRAMLHQLEPLVTDLVTVVATVITERQRPNNSHRSARIHG